MALVRSSLFDSARGSFANLTLRERRNGRIELGQKRIPADPQSSAQLDVRAGYGRLLETWNTQGWISASQYARLAAQDDFSAWNAWIATHQGMMSKDPGWYWPLAEAAGHQLHPITPETDELSISGPEWIGYGPAELSALHFRPTDDYIFADNPGPLRLQLDESIIVACTMRADRRSPEQSLISQLDRAPTYWRGYYLFFTEVGKVWFSLYDGTQPGGTDPLRMISSAAVDDGEWHTILAYVDRAEKKGYLYIDDVLEDTADDNTTQTSDNTKPWYFGVREGGDYYFKGDVADIMIKKWVP